MKNPESIALMGAVAGSVIGIAGGLLGTYFSIKNTYGPRERRLMILTALVIWAILGAALAMAYAFPSLRPWMWAPIAITVLLVIPRVNRRQQEIRREELNARNTAGPQDPAK